MGKQLGPQGGYLSFPPTITLRSIPLHLCSAERGEASIGHVQAFGDHLCLRPCRSRVGRPCLVGFAGWNRNKKTRLVGLGWVGLGWVGLGWVGLGWVGLGWVGLGWVGLGWVGLGWLVGWLVGWLFWIACSLLLLLRYRPSNLGRVSPMIPRCRHGLPPRRLCFQTLLGEKIDVRSILVAFRGLSDGIVSWKPPGKDRWRNATPMESCWPHGPENEVTFWELCHRSFHDWCIKSYCSLPRTLVHNLGRIFPTECPKFKHHRTPKTTVPTKNAWRSVIILKQPLGAFLLWKIPPKKVMIFIACDMSWISLDLRPFNKGFLPGMMSPETSRIELSNKSSARFVQVREFPCSTKNIRQKACSITPDWLLETDAVTHLDGSHGCTLLVYASRSTSQLKL